MLDSGEAADVARRFGVAMEQVRRDHFLSHLLAALAAVPDCTDRLVLVGGTGLARTHLVDGRLSEDIDLLVRGPRRDVAVDIEQALDRGVRRALGRLRWNPALRQARGSEPAVVEAPSGLGIRVQLLSAANYPDWPTEVRDLEQRYFDAPPVRLRVLTLPAFVAAKTVAWADRAASRDLFDLWALATRGAIDAEAIRLYVDHGPTTRPPGSWLFNRPPTEPQWRAELEAQTRLTVSAREAVEQRHLDRAHACPSCGNGGD